MQDAARGASKDARGPGSSVSSVRKATMNPISVALKGKGLINLVQRSTSIARRYGVTAGKMARAMRQFAAILRQFECNATFPITGVALQRNPEVVRKYQEQGIEFAIHGYRHVDHTQLSRGEQSEHLALARQAFSRADIQVQGFRSPYLRWNPDTLAVLQEQGFAYDGSQGLAWNVLDGNETLAYKRVLGFYGALPAERYPSLPSLEGSLVRIPYSLPDDEALVERLDLQTADEMNAPWLATLQRTHALGELLTLGLHPERIEPCTGPLTAVLAEARRLTPGVWIARLDEIAAWWRTRTEASVEVSDAGDGGLRLTVTGPRGVSVLARAVETDAPTTAWANGYRQVAVTTLTIRAPQRPFIGISPGTAPGLAHFLRQQGYILETSEDKHLHSHYVHRAEFAPEDQRALLTEIEGSDGSLVRLSRWPDGARSALSITGDIDALTLFDYGLRALGR
jgi:peptidoglycan/xylan/chitin deacetylase (PgdA/CDA1 family)